MSLEILKRKDKEIRFLKDQIKALQDEIKNNEKRTFKDYKFTSCNDCINKVDNKFTEICFSCKRYYGCYFEKKEKNEQSL